jgi:EREBP-like factor
MPTMLISTKKMHNNPLMNFYNGNDDLSSVLNFNDNNATFMPVRNFRSLTLTKAPEIPRMDMFPVQSIFPSDALLPSVDMSMFSGPTLDGPSTMAERNEVTLASVLGNAMYDLPLTMPVASDVEMKIDQPAIKEIANQGMPSILQGDVSEDVAAEINMWSFCGHLPSASAYY